MNQTARQAAKQYIFKSKYNGGARVIEIETAAFMAGWEAGQPKWTTIDPYADPMLPSSNYPAANQTVLFKSYAPGNRYHEQIFAGRFNGDAFTTPQWRHWASAWCAIPDSLLNFKS